MFSRQRLAEVRQAIPLSVRVLTGLTLAAALGGVVTYVASASNVTRVPTMVTSSGVERSGVENSVNIRPWSENLSKDAVDALGIELDLDGNESALVTSDCIVESPACR